jgi:hypothetical protein
MAGGLVEAQTIGGFFLDQQKIAIAFDERGNGNVRFPDFHGRILAVQFH